ncbi:SWIM zinc finger family protein [Brachybacterium sacelli]|uniref:Zn finger protein n=1 Tax=Brachybacterium sacelli TaxID=173364 RepID=A0ABS4WY51_9MICO|nr:SWIM zinc finger family protein [Brachybacterium sacelli]MBP2381122.1 putative Zn finger protein [Brachybacterium sacelli]
MSIRLLSRRGAIGKSWHAVALRDAAERLLGVGRAGSGKADARAGRVQWLDVTTGVARGDVLDADGELYRARLDLPAFPSDDREEFLRIARARPELPARLAGGDYPEEFERELAGSELSLLPRGAAELSHDCSCLDWPGPCRHVAALVYVLVETVDDKPVHLLTLRGLTLEDLVAPREAASPRRAEPGEEHDGGAADGSGEANGDPSDPVPAPYDPTRTDPALLAEVIGADPARIIARFYGSAAAGDTQTDVG